MIRWGRRVFLIGVGNSAFLLAALNAAVDYGWIRVNTSPSAPLGVYALDRHKPLRRGDLVAVCPHETGEVWRVARERGYLGLGRCRGGWPRLYKPVVGLPGDAVSIKREGVSVGGSVVPQSAARSVDRRGRPLTAATLDRTLSNEVVLVSSSPLAFDSRYFGVVSVDAIEGTLVPVFVWEGK